MSYKIQEIEGIGPAHAEKLAAADIDTTGELLKLCCDAKGRKATAEKTGVSESQLLKWANMADLMRISGVARQYSELLEAAGVDTVKELRNRNAANLAAKMAEAVREHGIELFHVHYAIPHAIAGVIAQQMLGEGAPRMVTTLHGTDITIVGQDHSFFDITRFGIERSDGVTTVSEFLRRMTVEEFGIDGFRIDLAGHTVGQDLVDPFKPAIDVAIGRGVEQTQIGRGRIDDAGGVGNVFEHAGFACRRSPCAHRKEYGGECGPSRRPHPAAPWHRSEAARFRPSGRSFRR